MVGLWSAWTLAEQGASVAVIDAALDGQASAAGGGILAPIPPTRYSDELRVLLDRSLAFYPAACERLHSDTGISPEYWRSGCWLLGETIDPGVREQPPAWLEGSEEALTPTSIAGESPRGMSSWLPEVAQIRPPRLLEALLRQCERMGVECWRGRVTAIDPRSKPVGIVCLEDGRQLRGAQLVVCAGTWASDLLPKIEVTPVAGQMLALDAGAHCPESIVIESGRYLIPRRDGVVIVGSSLHPGRWDLTPDDEDTAALLQFAVQIHAPLADAPMLRRWCGLRPAIVDRRDMPLIQSCETAPNLHWAIGHYRLGLSLAPATAERVRELVIPSA